MFAAFMSAFKAAFVAAFETAFVSGFEAAFVAHFVSAFNAAFVAAFEMPVLAVFMEGSVGASIGEVSVKVNAAAAIVIATVRRPVIRTASCQCQARNDQASNDRPAEVRRPPSREAAPARGGESRFNKRAFHH
jgi:hypothetical protein